jgi:hypothetical protein
MTDWDFDLLESLITDRGDEVIWETAIACPCRREDASMSFADDQGAAARIRSLSCVQCHGDGFIYRNAQLITGLLTQINAGNRRLVEAGYLLPGDCTFSPSLRGPKINDFDKITFTFSEVLDEGQVICRNAARLNENKTMPTSLAANEDRLWYNGDCGIWCEDENGVVYDSGVDYTLCGNKIQWIGNKPADNVYYTLKYTCFYEWIAYASPLTRIDRGRDLAQRCILRRKHVAFMNETDKATPSQRQANQLSLTGRIKI